MCTMHTYISNTIGQGKLYLANIKQEEYDQVDIWWEIAHSLAGEQYTENFQLIEGIHNPNVVFFKLKIKE